MFFIESFTLPIWIHPLIHAAISFVLFWGLGILLEKAILKINVTQEYNHVIIALLAGATKKICIGMGLLSLAGSLGIDVRGLLAGIGLTGFALGFALKDFLANTIAGIFILLYRPFKLGNTIAVETTTNKTVYQGKVTQVDLRYTTLENSDATILIPNSILFTNAISIVKSTK